ncbi:MAG TPA: bifunctional alpha,alpha-trehalose-phosphate synthase (UDP-forming)/trehalose-phosphatase [Gemmatimonadaceae bacterium]|nr:bifunctional alpha,alpha-trehalose-phosphate synthase (UDP-forming)/trehalose-phosphatase [Gemmatimonadaceae bacterium]
MSRVVNVSARLPVTARVLNGELRVSRSAGGVATGLRTALSERENLWIGWPGISLGRLGGHREALDERLARDGLLGVHLEEKRQRGFYESISNGVLWPMLHSQPDRLPVELKHWDDYADVNRSFADVVEDAWQPGDTIWVHDYQLMLLPAMLRERLPEARVGFFLHVPFPPVELFALLPHREELLEGMLGADLIGVHTNGYQRNLLATLRSLLGLRPGIETVRVGPRRVTLGVYPMGVDAERFAGMAARPELREATARMKEASASRTLLGIDRLDYTKGINRRLHAFERLLERHEEMRGNVRLLQVAVPSRTQVAAYARLREHVDGLVGRINGAFGSPEWTPVQYLFRSVTQDELVTFYGAAYVMLVTPVRDGMNLVAKEFIASRIDGDGVLVLSEFTGAADELPGAVLVNPYDVDRTATAIHTALTLPEEERRARMRRMRERVLGYTVRTWADEFLAALEMDRPLAPSQSPARTMVPPAVRERLQSASHLRLLLDYDGTLVPLQATPEEAAPDETLRVLLRRLAARPLTEVHVVSGRTRETLDAWLGDLPVGLHAEHGLWSRRAPSGPWRQRVRAKESWRAPLRRILERFAERTPGARVEEKSFGFAWHWRGASSAYGQWQANELRAHLVQVLAEAPVDVLEGNAVLEIRPHGVNKGLVTESVAAAAPPGTLIVAIGDDRTDEDLFAALPADGISIAVGAAPRQATARLTGPVDVLALLDRIADRSANSTAERTTV